MPDQRRVTENTFAEVREIFDHYDRDKNGVIDREEFASLLEALGAGFSKEETDAGFADIDDNDNGVIEFDEFIRWWLDR